MATKPTIVIPKEQHGIVTAKRALSPKIFVVQLQTEASITYLAGQYASWLIDGFRRPLSYATPDSYPYLEFVIDVSPGGVASQYTLNLKPGDTVRFLTPYGRFTVDPFVTRPLLFIATGSGIGPIRAQILEQLARDHNRALTLIFGNQDEHYMFFDDEFTELAAIHPNVTFIPVCSAPSDLWQGERGLVTEVALRRIPNLKDYESYVCGGPRMVTDTIAMLAQAGVDPAQIHSEQFAEKQQVR